jgi:hypothetical protein
MQENQCNGQSACPGWLAIFTGWKAWEITQTIRQIDAYRTQLAQ